MIVLFSTSSNIYDTTGAAFSTWEKDENLQIFSKQPSFSAYIYAHGSSMKLHNCIYTLQDTLINLVCGCCLITLETCVQSCLKLIYGRSAAAFMSYRRSTHRVLMSKFKYSKPIQQKMSMLWIPDRQPFSLPRKPQTFENDMWQEMYDISI